MTRLANSKRNCCFFTFVLSIAFLLLYRYVISYNSSGHLIEYPDKPFKFQNEFYENYQIFIDAYVQKLRIYIPHIGDEFNRNIEQLNYDKCKHLDRMNYGHGKRIHLNGSTPEAYTPIVQFETEQFVSDIIIYNRIQNDSFIIAKNIDQANVVLMPFMAGSACSEYAFSLNNLSTYQSLYHKMALWMQDNQNKLKNKVILMFNSTTEDCPIRDDTQSIIKDFNIHLLGIEDYRYTNRHKFTLIPYPTFVKFAYKQNEIEYTYDLNGKRDIDILFTGDRRGNIYRQTIFEHILTRTMLNYSDFKLNNSIDNLKSQSKHNVLSLILQFEKCKWTDGIVKTYEYKMNSKLCLEPHGDTPTRRSFWDSVFLGCIPVIFTKVDLPFRNMIDYSKFVVQLNQSDLDSVRTKQTDFVQLFQPYLQNTQWMNNARAYIKNIRQFIQYTWMFNKNDLLIDTNFYYDAYGMVLANFARDARL